MQNQATTNLQLVLRNDQLKKLKGTEEVQNFLDSVVLPLIVDSLTSASKNPSGSVGIQCDRNGCTVRGGINF